MPAGPRGRPRRPADAAGADPRRRRRSAGARNSSRGMFGPSAKNQAPVASPWGVTVMPVTAGSGRRAGSEGRGGGGQLRQRGRCERLQFGRAFGTAGRQAQLGCARPGGAMKCSWPKPRPPRGPFGAGLAACAAAWRGAQLAAAAHAARRTRALARTGVDRVRQLDRARR